MVARSGSSLRFSVRHQRDEKGAVAPPRTRLHDRKVFNADDTADLDARDISKTNRQDNSGKSTRATKVSTRRNSDNNASVKQSNSPPRALPPPPSSRSTKTSTHPFSPSDVPGHERPLKRAKLDGSAHNASPSTSTNNIPRLPLRSRRNSGPGATRTRSSRDVNNTANNNSTPPVTLVPPPAADSADNKHTSPAPAISRPSGKLGNGVGDATDDVNGNEERNPVSDGNAGVGIDAPPDEKQGLTARRERRTLRSNDGASRSRSELAQYFPNYEQILSLKDMKPEFLSPETPVILVDDLKEPIIVASPTRPTKTKGTKKQHTNGYTDGEFPHNGPRNPLANLYQAQVIKLPSSKQSIKGQDADPLPDDIYSVHHRRIERQEKQLRNIEKERAQHEKVQLDRLLEELQSHDWLRTMGISGITDTEKKLYEPKRLYFIKEVSALINKFKVWKEEEKRRKAERDEEREQLLLDELEEEAEQRKKEVKKEKPQSQVQKKRQEESGKNNHAVSPDVQSNGESLDMNDIDALAARQLQQEASIASHRKGSKQSNTSNKQSPLEGPTPHSPSNHVDTLPPPLLPPSPEFKSFFAQPHLREAAMGKNRRGRMRLAFGQPLPDLPEREFSLPSDILTPEAIIASQRKKRRLRREQKS